MSERGRRANRRRSQVCWALWDFGSTGLNAIVVTFVFSVYLTSAVGDGLPGDTTPRAGSGGRWRSPVWWSPCWRRSPGSGSTHRTGGAAVLAALTGLAVLLTAAMSLIRDDYRYLLPGLVLLACTAACSDLATVPYNAMLRQLSTPQTSGRISGFGWAMGYFGSVLLLLVVYSASSPATATPAALLDIPVADGQNVRAAMLLAAAWFALFALPLLITVPHRRRRRRMRAASPSASSAPTASCASEVAGEWRRDRNVVYYLLASAVFRDGLTGLFAFGAVLGVTVYGISEADVLLFGVSASVIAAVGAVLGGLLDDRLGSKPVIVGSLTAMIAIGLTLMTLSGAVAFWICGLLLCLFIGPTQSSARTLMLRMSADGKEGVAFGLYTTTGRAVSFLAPLLFSVFIDVFGTDRAGMGGLLVVLAAGLAAMLAVRVPRRPAVR